MTFDKFTIKAQEAIQSAVNAAREHQQQSIEPTHLLYGVTEKGKDICSFIFQKLGINSQQIDTLIENELQHLPKVSGGEPYLANDRRFCSTPSTSRRRWAMSL